MALLKQQWKSDRGTVLSWCVTVILLTWLVMGIYWVLAESGSLDFLAEMVAVMPPYVQALLGKGGFGVFGAYVTSMQYGGVMFITFIIFISVYVPGLISREVDKRSSEFLLSLPVTRTSVMNSRWLGLCGSLIALALSQWLTLIIVSGSDVQPARYLLASLNMVLVFLETGGLVLLVSVFIDDYARAVGIGASVATFLFFFSAMTENATGALSAVRRVLPFARFDASTILSSGSVPVADMMVLVAGIAVLYLATVKAFNSKQIAG